MSSYTVYRYSSVELLKLRDDLQLGLKNREHILGAAVISTHGSVQAGTADPNDIDLKVKIENSLGERSVQDAAKDAVRTVIHENCFAGKIARLLMKSGVWQWPLDVCISDGVRELWLKAISNPTSCEIRFELIHAS